MREIWRLKQETGYDNQAHHRKEGMMSSEPDEGFSSADYDQYGEQMSADYEAQQAEIDDGEAYSAGGE